MTSPPPFLLFLTLFPLFLTLFPLFLTLFSHTPPLHGESD